MREAVIHRVLGALRFVDATTGQPIAPKLRFSADKRIDLRRNASGAYVVWGADGLETHTGHQAGATEADLEALFESPPTAPPAGSIAYDITVDDPTGALLSRRFELRLPRAPTGDLFEALEVPLYRAPASRPSGSSAVIYVFVHDGRGQPGKLPGAVVTLKVSGVEVGRGVTGPTGEALIEATSLASFVIAEGGSALTTKEIAATVRAAVLPTSLRQEAGTWRVEVQPNPESPAFEGPSAKSATAQVSLTVGRPANVSLSISL